MKRLSVIAAAIFAVGVLAATSACATGYGYDRGRYGGYDGGVYRNGGYYREIERRAYDNGFREGIRAGEKDGRSRRRYDPSRHGDWRDADDGYRREYGDHTLYRHSFRSGFEAGYSQGYGRYAGYYRRY